MLVTIAVLNYNYRRFVAQAIESALAQTWRELEVVVVDNGSTDGSLDVIRPYADRVRIVEIAHNIGQGHGYNACIAAARGEWLVWLDADDVLDAGCIETCMSMADETTSKVQFPMRLIDADGAPVGGMVPYLSHEGDVVPLIRRFGHYAGPPGSGNLYRRSAVAPYFPVPTGEWPIGTDTVPFVTAAFHGRVVDTKRPLASYRLHRKAPSSIPGYRGNYSSSIAAEVTLNSGSRDRTLAMVRERTGIDVQGPFLTLPPHMRNRIISWRLAPERHPFPEDDAGSLSRLMAQSLRACPGYTSLDRAVIRAWAMGVLRLPLPMAQRLMSAQRTSRLGDVVTRWSQGRSDDNRVRPG
jgi:Glycosyl transferase family 2